MLSLLVFAALMLSYIWWILSSNGTGGKRPLISGPLPGSPPYPLHVLPPAPGVPGVAFQLLCSSAGFSIDVKGQTDAGDDKDYLMRIISCWGINDRKEH